MDTTTMLENQLVYVQCLYEIMLESEEPDIIRRALAALTSTSAGREYLEMNPITV